jgi:Domain of unknown function (DUF4352)/Protein of unknown function (DUF2510)
MTTPPTPAGWYPDPDGSGGQRYWDGSAWTEHRSPATPEPAEPIAAAEPPGSEQPTVVVQMPHVGAHRAAEQEPEPAPPPEPAPGPEPEPGPTAVLDLGSTVPSEQPTTRVIPPTPPAEPLYFGTPLEPPPSGAAAAPDDRRRLIIWFGAACAALLVVLALVVVYELFIHKDNTTQIASGSGSTSKSATPTTSASGGSSATKTTGQSPTGVPPAGAVTDGNFSFEVTQVETAPSVKYGDPPVEKTAQGEFLIVHMTVTNTGAMSATFLGTLQKLKAGGTTYAIDDEATSYLNGGMAQLNPGDQTALAIAFDVPQGTTPESLEVHGDPTSAGAEVPIS